MKNTNSWTLNPNTTLWTWRRIHMTRCKVVTHTIFFLKRERDMCEFLSNLTCSQLWWNSPFQIDRTSSGSQNRGIISSQMYFKHAQIVRLCTMLLLHQHIVIFHRALVLICKLFKITYSHTVTEFEIDSVNNFCNCMETLRNFL